MGPICLNTRKSIPVSRFTGKWVDYSFVLLESTRTIYFSPYSVNVTVTNELLEAYKTLISAKTLCFMIFFLILSLLPIQKGGYFVYILNVDTSLYRHEST